MSVQWVIQMFLADRDIGRKTDRQASRQAGSRLRLKDKQTDKQVRSVDIWISRQAVR